MTEKISDAVIDEMLAGLKGVPSGPYAYRPKRFDDWGFVRDPAGHLVCVAKNSRLSTDDYDQARFDEVDPLEAIGNHFTRCSPETIRALLLELRAYRTAANPLQTVADGVAAAQKRIEKLGLVGTPLIDSMSDEEFAADRSDENPNVGQAVVDRFPGKYPDFYAVHSVTGSHIGLWADRTFAGNVLRDYPGGKLTPLYTAPPTLEITPATVIRAEFRTEEGGLVGSTDAPVSRIERQDDGSITVVIAHWPTPAPVSEITEDMAERGAEALRRLYRGETPDDENFYLMAKSVLTAAMVGK